MQEPIYGGICPVIDDNFTQNQSVSKERRKHCFNKKNSKKISLGQCHTPLVNVLWNPLGTDNAWCDWVCLWVIDVISSFWSVNLPAPGAAKHELFFPSGHVDNNTFINAKLIQILDSVYYFHSYWSLLDSFFTWNHWGSWHFCLFYLISAWLEYQWPVPATNRTDWSSSIPLRAPVTSACRVW